MQISGEKSFINITIMETVEQINFRKKKNQAGNQNLISGRNYCFSNNYGEEIKQPPKGIKLKL